MEVNGRQQLVATCQPLAELGTLEPYLASLNVTEALEDFGRLADSILSRSSDDSASSDAHSRAHCPSADSLGHCSFLATSHADGHVLPPLSVSPSCSQVDSCHAHYSDTSLTPSSQWELSSSAGSPSGSYSYSSGSASPLSRNSSASSVQAYAGGGSSSSRTTHGRRRAAAESAERYRKRLKGRKCSLEEELELEQERRSHLLASIESKMLLYREFALLLAANTRDPERDATLARIGLQSLESVLECVAPVGLLDGPERVELEQTREHFRHLAGAPVACKPTGSWAGSFH